MTEDGDIPRSSDPARLPFAPFALLQRGEAYERFRLLEAPTSAHGVARATAYDPKLDRRVSLCVVSQPAPAGVKAQVERATRVVAKSSSLGLLPVLDAGTLAEEAFVATEAALPSDTLDAYLSRRPPWRELAATLVELAPAVEEIERAGFGALALRPDCIVVKEGHARIDLVRLAGRPPPLPDGNTVESYRSLVTAALRAASGGVPMRLLEALEDLHGGVGRAPIEAMTRLVREHAELEGDPDTRTKDRMWLVAVLVALDGAAPLVFVAADLAAAVCSPLGAAAWASGELVFGWLGWRALGRGVRPGPLAQTVFRLLVLAIVLKPVEAIGLALLGAAPFFPALHLATRAALAAAIAALFLPKQFSITAFVFAVAAVAAAFVPSRAMLILGATQAMFASSFARSARAWGRR